MSNKEILNFKVEEIDSKPYVTFEMPVANNINSKETRSLPLQDFVEFCKNFEDLSVIDSGYVVPNLTRHIRNGSRQEFLFFYPTVRANFTFNISQRCNTLYKDLLKCKTLFKSRKLTSDEREDMDRSGYLVELCEPVIFKNMYYHLMIDSASSTVFKENVLIASEPEGLLGKVVPKDSSKVVRSYFPNHYSDKVCWGNTGYGHGNIIHNLREGNINYINTALPTYFNSNFNTDLMFIGIGDWTEDYMSPEFLESFYEWCTTYYTENIITAMRDQFRTSSDGTCTLVYQEGGNMVLMMLILTAVSMDVSLRTKFLEGARSYTLSSIYQLLGTTPR